MIVITGMNDDELIQQVKELKVDALIHKPMSIPDFIEIAKKSLEVEVNETVPEFEDQKKPSTLKQEAATDERHLADVLSNLRGQLSASSVMLIV